jgi:hypothetical protein
MFQRVSFTGNCATPLPLSGRRRRQHQRKRYPWPSSVAWHVPEATSHILIIVSYDADTIVLPVGANSHAETTSLPFLEM